MNYSLTILEMAVLALGLGLLLLDLWAPMERKRQLGYAAAAALGLVLLFSFSSLVDSGTPATAFKGMYVLDGLADRLRDVAVIIGCGVGALRGGSPSALAWTLAATAVSVGGIGRSQIGTHTPIVPTGVIATVAG